MKNIRKIVAILAAALMLFSVMPLGAFAAGDVVVDYNFDDGNAHFERGYVENGYMVFDATTADWQNCYLYANAMKANTDYVMTFKAKADKDAGLNVKINNNWAGDTAKETVSVTTEWQDFEVMINTGDLTGTALLMFTSDYPAGSAPIYCIDDLKVVEYVEPAVPGQIVNGDFETGDLSGWEHHQSTAISTDAHSGSYAVNVKGAGNWNGMLNQDIPVEAGKPYEINLWAKTISNGVNIQVKDGGTEGANLASEWFTKTEWTNIVWEVIPTTDIICINFCGGGNGIAEDVLVDDITVTELKAPSFDGYITNGDFEMGEPVAWENVWGSCQVAMVEGRNGGYAMQITAGQWNIVRQKVAVQPNTDYVVKAYGKNANNMTLLVKDGNDGGNLMQAGFSSSDDFKATSLEFNSGDWSEVYICFMGNVAGSSVIVDDVMMFEKVEASNDGYIINGTFETGDIAPWDNLWGSCPKAEVIKGGLDSNFALEIISGQWKHVRQTNIAVEPNTDYKITAWVKNAAGMSLLVKDGADKVDIVNAGIEAGEEWTEFTAEFNTGDYTTIIFSLMGNNAEAAFGTFDNIVMKKIEAPACEHEYDDCLDADCNLCGETRENVGHNLTYFEAVVAANCQETSHDEYWFCENCGCYFGDAEATWQHNPGWLFTPGECVRPEGAADCAIVPCEVCGNDVYGYGEHDVLTCQGGICSKCNAEIEGVGCQNYDTPACEDGVCYYCGGFVAGFGHENGATAPCVDGECSYGCGLIYPATEDHVDADADDYCDNCWNHLACIDADADGFCDICWEMMPEAPVEPEIVYGDADGDGEISNLDYALLGQYLAKYDVTVNEAAADADGDGEISNLDYALLGQYLAKYDVTLGPKEEPTLFNDGELTKW